MTVEGNCPGVAAGVGAVPEPGESTGVEPSTRSSMTSMRVFTATAAKGA